jgi:hypothetical protein
MAAPSEKIKDKDKAKTHKLSLKGSSKLVAEFVSRHPRGKTAQRFPEHLMHGAPKLTAFNAVVPILNTYDPV